jgi:alpha-galactosidase
MMDPHAAAELDLDQIWSMTEDLIAAHGNMLPGWTQGSKFRQAAE